MLTRPSCSSRARLIAASWCGALASLAVLACQACSDFGTAPADDASTDGGAVRVSSCRGLLAQNPSLHGKSGIYTIAPGNVAALDVYCEMTLDDGGWTLAGRSGAEVPGTPPPFGWSSATGNLQDTNMPYSLNVVANQLMFTEVLVATPDGRRAYKAAIGSTFLTTRTDTVKTGTVLTLAGDCAPPGGPEMLRNTGATSLTDDFFFRDIPDPGQHRGLNPGGFSLTYQDCTRGGSLDGAQGVIMVR